MTMRWYVLHAYSGFEHQVRKSLEERVARAGMQEYFGQVLVPTEEVVEMRDGQKRKSVDGAKPSSVPRSQCTTPA